MKKFRAPKAMVAFVSLKELQRFVSSQTEILNGRGVKFMKEEVRFRFSKAGRFDSFTTRCDNIADAEHVYGFPFSENSDHAFIYTKMSAIEPSPLDGYALLLIGKQLHWFGGRYDSLMQVDWKEIRPISPAKLLDFLNGALAFLKEDTYIEQMWWVQQARKQGLLDPAYPEFDVAFAGNTPNSAIRAFPLGEKSGEKALLLNYR